MRNRTILVTVAVIASVLHLVSARAADHGPLDNGWVNAGRTLDNSTTVYLSGQFGQKSGTFKAMPESMLDKQDHVSGTFLVGTFRQVLDDTAEDMHGLQYDESITTEVLDCQNAYFGTLRQVEKLRGKVVQDLVTPDHDINMMQSHIAYIDLALCDLHQGKANISIAPVANPDYNPHSTAVDYDKLVDKYSHPATASPSADNGH